MSPEDISAFERDGMVVLRGALSGRPELTALMQEVEAFGRTYAQDFRLADCSGLLAQGAGVRGDFYRALRYLPSLAALGSSAFMLQLARQAGLRFPLLMKSCNVRMDLPHADEQLFQWHQDITYLLGSLNSITLWLPLGPADAVHGSIACVPGTHRALRAYEPATEVALTKSAQLSPRDLRLQREPETTGEILAVDVGDVVLFSQFLLHRSTPNRSQRCRWTVQLRYSDLLEPSFRGAGFPLGDMTTILRTRYLERYGEAAEADSRLTPA